jgi:hypothetical protein
MRLTMKVEYDREEVEEAMKAVYLARFGPPPEGYHLFVTESFGSVTVATYEDDEPVPAIAVPVEPASVEVETGKPDDIVVPTKARPRDIGVPVCKGQESDELWV